MYIFAGGEVTHIPREFRCLDMELRKDGLGIGIELHLTCMKVAMTFDLACGVFSSRISVGTSRASRLNDRTIAITLGASLF